MIFRFIYTVVVLITLVIIGCNRNTKISQEEEKNSNDSTTRKEYYSNGQLKMSEQLFKGKRNGMTINYYENGKFKLIENYLNDTINGEVILYYPSGVIRKKEMLSMGLRNGPAYAFYEDGFIKEYRKWVNGKKEGYSEDYWDIDGNIKVVYFAKNDSLQYKRTFDSVGNVLQSVGTPPNEHNSKVN